MIITIWLYATILNCGLALREQHLKMYVGLVRRLKTLVVLEVRRMVTYCLTDMRTNMAKNIFRICDKFHLDISTDTSASEAGVHAAHSAAGR